MPTNYAQLYTIKQERRKQIKQLLPSIEDKSGIYMFYRKKEDKTCVYIGLATKSVWDRCSQHLDGYKTKNPSHIDKSLKTHGLYSSQNEDGWKLSILTYCSSDKCNELEQMYISHYRSMENIVIYNITIGSQGKGKVDFQERNQTKLKSYANGKQIGYEKARKEIALLFTKYLTYNVKKANILSQKAKERFEKFLKGASEND